MMQPEELRGLTFPAITARLFEGFESQRGRPLGQRQRARLIESLDYYLVSSKAPVDYLEELLFECIEADSEQAHVILATAHYGYRYKVAPKYIAAVFMLPFASEGCDEFTRAENRVAILHEGGVPWEYAYALRRTRLSAREVARCWQDGLSAEYVTAAY